jgi:CBS domain-containing protein
MISTAAPTLSPEDTVGTAYDMLLKHRVLALPVVDAQGLYRGMFAKSRLFGLLLPVVGGIEDLLPQMAASPALLDKPEVLQEVRARLRSLSDHLVGTYADATVPVLHQDSPLLAAVLLVYRVRNFVPVVDKESGRYLGTISTWDALDRLRG